MFVVTESERCVVILEGVVDRLLLNVLSTSINVSGNAFLISYVATIITTKHHIHEPFTAKDKMHVGGSECRMDINIKLLINCYSLNSSAGGQEIVMCVLGTWVPSSLSDI